MEHNQSNLGLDQCHDCGVRRKQVANPTTNYGFVLPTPTDLVTDLPADFDVALQGVDTQLKALQPGTTLGDLAYSSATANTNTRLAIGSTNDVLTVAGGVPTWAAPAGGGMTLIGTTTLSGASTTISSIPQTYYNLMFQFDMTSSVTGYPKFTFNGAGTTLSLTKEANSTAWNNQGSLGFITPQGTAVNQTDSVGQMMVYNYFAAGFSTMALSSVYGPSPYQNTVNYGSSQSAFALSSLLIAWSSGGTLSGTVKMYGIK
jgi:hypothetical protein